VALDVWAVTDDNAPQPPEFAKRLLDQLGDVDGKPIIYTDDRQVSMLFVRVDQHRSTTTPPTIFFAAQRSSLVRETVRFAHDRRDEDRDDYRDREIDWQQRIDAAEDAVDTRRGVDSDMGRRWYARELYNLQFLTQRSVIDGVDNLAAHVVQSYASLLVELDEVVQLGVDAEVDAHSASSMNSAIDAVNPCNALRPAIGPISPAAKKPASGMPPSSSSIVDAS
jgi:hypothetical protein